MTSSEKATDLVYKFLNAQTNTESIEEAKNSALICVKELFYNNIKNESASFWAEVEEEVEKH
tara:strand:- start:1352 stop:1537 length:186 start_codon:yes stop_codon:yes gene_type:complete